MEQHAVGPDSDPRSSPFGRQSAAPIPSYHRFWTYDCHLPNTIELGNQLGKYPPGKAPETDPKSTPMCEKGSQ